MASKIPDVQRRRSNGRKWLWVGAAVIGLASAGLYFSRDARETMSPLLQSAKPEEGSLSVNINTASQEELESIPGFGAAVALQIIEGRPYSKVEELEKVYGLGHNLVESLRPYVKVDGPTVKRAP